MKTICLTPEQHVIIYAIPATATYTRYIFWCGIFALNGLPLPLTIHNCPVWDKDENGIKCWRYNPV
jgi:hypothetical protein